MSEHPFDSLARTLAAGASRRGVLRAIGGAVLGSLVAAPAQTVLAQGNSDCAHFCNNIEPPGPGRGECKSDAAHGQGLCYSCGPAAPAGHPDVCGVGTNGVTCCSATAPNCCGNTTCVNLQSDVNNCGTCGQVCKAPANATAVCTAGKCGFVCNSGFFLCNGACVNEQTDVNNCGACGHVCPSGATCVTGSCICTGTNGQPPCNGVCCPAGTSCSNGVCCPTGTTNCGGACVNEQTDVNNCGACGHVCTAPANASPMCTNRACSFVCNQGYSRCGNACVNEQTDLNNCGACGHVCSFPNATATCSSGTCALGVCNAGFGNCDGNAANGCETNLQTDARNCSACGYACSAGQTCSNGTCVTSSFACPPFDLAGRSLIAHTEGGGELFCRYQVIPNDFFCKYFESTGLEKQDHDDGFCPPVAVPSVP